MIHAGCGGVVLEDTTRKPYEYELEDGTIELHYPLVCRECMNEILGDDEIEGGVIGDLHN